jgi:hypothetical protein
LSIPGAASACQPRTTAPPSPQVGPSKDVEVFRTKLTNSLKLLAPDDPAAETGSGFIDLFAMHGTDRRRR